MFTVQQKCRFVLFLQNLNELLCVNFHQFQGLALLSFCFEFLFSSKDLAKLWRSLASGAILWLLPHRRTSCSTKPANLTWKNVYPCRDFKQWHDRERVEWWTELVSYTGLSQSFHIVNEMKRVEDPFGFLEVPVCGYLAADEYEFPRLRWCNVEARNLMRSSDACRRYSWWDKFNSHTHSRGSLFWVKCPESRFHNYQIVQRKLGSYARKVAIKKPTRKFLVPRRWPKTRIMDSYRRPRPKSV